MDPLAQRVAARFKAAARSFDPSVLGITPSELKEMDDEERIQALYEALMQAADLSEAIEAAFANDLSSADRQTIGTAAKDLIEVGRRVHDELHRRPGH